MKYLHNFNEFEEVDPNLAGGESGEESKSIKKQDIVIGRDFFRELKVTIKYWFKFGRMSKEQEDHKGRKISFELQDVEQTPSELTLWFTYFLENKEKYVWKVCYKLESPDAEIESINTIVVYFYCYDNAEVNLIKQMDQKVDVKEDLKEKVFLRTIKDITKTILEEPKDDKEAKSVADSDSLTDQIY